jgi:hypothetical protein
LTSPPAVSMAPDGRFVVAWHDALEFNVFAQVYDAAGAAVGAAIKVNESGKIPSQENLAEPYEQNPPPQSVAIVENGDFVVAWTRGSPDNTPMLRRFDAKGSAFSPQEKPAMETGYTRRAAGTAASKGKGSHLVVWTTGDEFQVKHTLFRAN